MNPTPDNPSDINSSKTAENGEKAFKRFRSIRNLRFSPTKPTKAYLIYHHDSYDYDSQTIPLMVCESKERAEDVVAEICVFGASLGRRLFDEYRDENGHLLPPKGMWCKVEDAMAKINLLEEVLRRIACDLSVGGYNSPTVDPLAFYEKISWGIDEFAKSYHQLQVDLAAKAKKEIFEPLMIDSTKDD